MELKDIAGFAELLKVLRDEIIPWRRQHAKEMARLEAKAMEAEIDRTNVETRRILVELAQKIIAFEAPDLPKEKRNRPIYELRPELYTLTNSQSEQIASMIFADSSPKVPETLMIEGTWRLTWAYDNRTLRGVLMLKQKEDSFKGAIVYNRKNLIKLEGRIAQNKAKYSYWPYAIEYYREAHPTERGEGFFNVLDGGVEIKGEWRSEDGAVTTCFAKRIGDLPGETSDQLTTP